ncbi:MAG: 50S ribosomal protein L17 [Candidatus Azambacteria bacterium]|nr:50S ribosomal protein L17 [Candidatus Azambacteria bacterium]
MKHLKKNRKFGRLADYRRSFLSNLTNALIEKERIRTTEARAKEIRSLVEKAISRSKNDTLANRRLLLRRYNPKTVNKLFHNLGPRFKEREGGYCRIMKLELRKNDSAKMVIIELLK